MPVRSKVTRTDTGLGNIEKALKELMTKRLLVGIPSGEMRQPQPGEKGPPVSNAVIGYVQEFGDDEKHIPARPFLVPGIRSVQGKIIECLKKAGEDAFEGDRSKIAARFEEAGLAAVVAVKQAIDAGGFAPLSERTIEARARRRYADTGKLVRGKSSRDARHFLKLRAQGTPDEVLHDAGLATPLLDTRSMYGSIQYLVKNKGGS